MTEEAILARLLAQHSGESVAFRALVEEASATGAKRALGELGLDDASARRDMDELRQLLSAWRDAKASARKAVIGWIIRIGLAALLIGIAVKLKLTGLITAP